MQVGNKIVLLWLLVTFFSCSAHENLQFSHEQSANHQKAKIVLKDDGQDIGHIYYKKLSSFFGSYLIHDLYIYPRKRGNCYATHLVNYTREFLTAQGARIIYLCPEPFEYVDGKVIFPTKKEVPLKTKRLKKLYERCLFVSRQPSYLERLTTGLSTHTMVYHVPHNTSPYDHFKLGVPIVILIALAYYYKATVGVSLHIPVGPLNIFFNQRI